MAKGKQVVTPVTNEAKKQAKVYEWGFCENVIPITGTVKIIPYTSKKDNLARVLICKVPDDPSGEETPLFIMSQRADMKGVSVRTTISKLWKVKEDAKPVEALVA